MIIGTRLPEPSGTIVTRSTDRLQRPGSPGSSVQFVEGSASKPRRVDDIELKMANWSALAQQELERAQHVAEANPLSATAHLNVIQLALQCEDAPAAAAAVVAAVEQLEVDYRESGVVDLAAPQILAQASARTPLAGPVADFLLRMPKRPSVKLALGSLLVDERRFGDAVEVLDEAEGAPALTLRGFALMQMGRSREAIACLRKALRKSPGDPDAAMLLSVAFRTTGAYRRSIQYALRASHIAPARHDLSIRALNLLLDAGHIREAQAEVDRVKSRGYIDTMEFLVVQARVALARNREGAAITLLQRAKSLASERKDDLAAVEIGIQLASLRSPNELSEDRAARILTALQEHPGSAVLVELLAGVLKRVEGAPILRSAIERAEPYCAQSELLAARVGLAQLELDFELALGLALRWEAAEPFNAIPPAIAAMYVGLLTDDWQRGARIAREALTRVPVTDPLLNNAAYTMALSGDHQKALELLTAAREETYHLVATRGLVLIARGDVQEGLRLYRRAADLADMDPDRDGRALMTLHQEMTLRRFRIDPSHSIAVEASSLPDPQLPDYWRSVPEFMLLRQVADAHGWPWPEAGGGA